jgi:hypothetical protein
MTAPATSPAENAAVERRAHERPALERPALDRLALVRSLLAGAEGRLGIVREVSVAGETASSPSPASLPSARTLPVSEDLAPLLPARVLRRGTVVAVEGSTSLVLALIARASREGSWTVIVGMPQVGVVAAARRGIDLARLALVPHPGAEAATVVGACIDGMDVVVLGPRLALGDADRRRLAARARERGTVLVSAGPWTGAHVALAVTRTSWSGLGAGDGRLRSRSLAVARSGRHLGAGDEATVVLDADDAALFPGRVAQARRGLRLV